MRICNFFKTTANVSYDQKCSPFGDHTKVSHDLQLLSLVQRLTYVHHSQATPLATHFWWQIIDPAQLHWGTSHFHSLVISTLTCSYCLAYTAAHLMCPQHFLWQQHFFITLTNVFFYVEDCGVSKAFLYCRLGMVREKKGGRGGPGEDCMVYKLYNFLFT